jgi:hypothetical protein
MMYGSDNGMAGWGYVLMVAALLVITGLVVAAAMVLTRSAYHPIRGRGRARCPGRDLMWTVCR